MLLVVLLLLLKIPFPLCVSIRKVSVDSSSGSVIISFVMVQPTDEPVKEILYSLFLSFHFQHFPSDFQNFHLCVSISHLFFRVDLSPTKHPSIMIMFDLNFPLYSSKTCVIFDPYACLVFSDSFFSWFLICLVIFCWKPDALCHLIGPVLSPSQCEVSVGLTSCLLQLLFPKVSHSVMVFGSLLSLGFPSDPLQIASGLLISTYCSSTVLLVVRRTEKKEGACNFLIRLNLLILMQLYIWALLLSRVAPPLLHRLRGQSQESPFDWKKTLVMYFFPSENRTLFQKEFQKVIPSSSSSQSFGGGDSWIFAMRTE